MISTRGEFTGSDGTSKSLGNELDRQRLIRLRSTAELIITDAKTAAIEAYRPSKFAPIEVWSRSEVLEGVSDGLTHLRISDLAAEIQRVSNSVVILEAGPTLTRAIAELGAIKQLELTVTGTSSIDLAAKAARGFAETLGLAGLQVKKQNLFESTAFFSLAQ